MSGTTSRTNRKKPPRHPRRPSVDQACQQLVREESAQFREELLEEILGVVRQERQAAAANAAREELQQFLEARFPVLVLDGVQKVLPALLPPLLTALLPPLLTSLLTPLLQQHEDAQVGLIRRTIQELFVSPPVPEPYVPTCIPRPPPAAALEAAAEVARRQEKAVAEATRLQEEAIEAIAEAARLQEEAATEARRQEKAAKEKAAKERRAAKEKAAKERRAAKEKAPARKRRPALATGVPPKVPRAAAGAVAPTSSRWSDGAPGLPDLSAEQLVDHLFGSCSPLAELSPASSPRETQPQPPTRQVARVEPSRPKTPTVQRRVQFQDEVVDLTA